jgi:hypothetical protein
MNTFDLHSLPIESAGADGEFDLLRSSVSLWICF